MGVGKLLENAARAFTENLHRLTPGAFKKRKRAEPEEEDHIDEQEHQRPKLRVVDQPRRVTEARIITKKAASTRIEGENAAARIGNLIKDAQQADDPLSLATIPLLDRPLVRFEWTQVKAPTLTYNTPAKPGFQSSILRPHRAAPVFSTQPVRNTFVSNGMGLNNSKEVFEPHAALVLQQQVQDHLEEEHSRLAAEANKKPKQKQAVDEVDLTAAQDAEPKGVVTKPADPVAKAQEWRKAFSVEPEPFSHFIKLDGGVEDQEDEGARRKREAAAAKKKKDQKDEELKQLLARYDVNHLQTKVAEDKYAEAEKLGEQLRRLRTKEVVRPLPSITDEQLERYQDVVNRRRGDPGEVLAQHKSTNIDIHRRDMHTMAPGEWVNDEIINVYMGLLQERDARGRNEKRGWPKCHFHNTFFANKLYKDGGYSYKDVRRWTLPKRLQNAGQLSDTITDCDMVVVPVHQGVHWVCAIINIKDKKLVYLDSLKGEDQNCLEQLAKYMQDEYKDKNKMDVNVLEWPREYPKNIPQQKNGCDCGVFTMLFADYVSTQDQMKFTQDDIQDYRVQIVDNILNTRVET